MEHQNNADQKSHNDLGIRNWMMIFLIGYVINYLLENYSTFGIVKNPFELTLMFIEFIQEWWWIYAVCFLCYIATAFTTFIIENLLALNVLSDSLGLLLHIISALGTTHLSAFLYYNYSINRVVAGALAPFALLSGFKLLSYAFANRRYRYQHINSKQLSTSGNTYPKNVTLKNLFSYILEPGLNYDNSQLHKKSTNFRKQLKIVAFVIVLHYLIAFIGYQYIIPELHIALKHFNSNNYIKLYQSFFKLMLPINIVWIIYFNWFLIKVFLPLRSNNDWWNSQNITVFWVKWNYEVHLFFKENIYATALGMGYGKRKSTYIVGLASGVLHEYVVSVPLRYAYGMPTVVMVLQVPLAIVSKFICNTFGDKYGNLFVWISLITFHTMCSMYIYFHIYS